MAAFSLEELSYVFLWALSVLKHFHQLSVVPIQQTNGFNVAFERLPTVGAFKQRVSTQFIHASLG